MTQSIISDRINLLIVSLGYNRSSFSREIGLTSNATIIRIIKEKRHPSYDVINKIALRFPNVNLEWLIAGRGEMLKTKYSVNSEEEITHFLKFCLDNNDKLLESEDFRNYIRMNMEYITTDDERAKQKEALEELKEIAKKKLLERKK